MLPPIIIDISDTVNAFYLSPEETASMSRYVTSRLADEYVRKWEHKIDNTLHQTRGEYKRAIFSEQIDDFNIAVGLTPRDSRLALMLEDGASEFDQKEGFKKSNKVKYTKEGKWYLTIPFRWATSQAIAESSTFSNKMPKPIEKLVKAQTTPLRFDQLPNRFKPLKSNQTSGYNHKFNIYEGIQRRQIGSGTENRGGYFSFRRVSEATDETAWIHPGFTALKLMEQTASDVDWFGVADIAIQEFLNNRE